MLPGFRRIAGVNAFRPALVAHIQTDGSFYPSGISKTSLILKNAKNTRTWAVVKPYNDSQHRNSTEAEWASIADGILFAISKNQNSLELENDNLGVIRILVGQLKPSEPSSNFYANYIWALGIEMNWLAVRWIPRKLNRADDLFRG